MEGYNGEDAECLGERREDRAFMQQRCVDKYSIEAGKKVKLGPVNWQERNPPNETWRRRARGSAHQGKRARGHQAGAGPLAGNVTAGSS
jgi:hypothetical protein